MYTKGAVVAQGVKCALAPLVCHEPWGCVPETEVLYSGLLCLWYLEFILWAFLVLVQGFYSVNLQHLHSWCLQRSTQTKGGEQWCFLQASEAQPTETPCEVTTWIPSEGCSSSREMERPLNLKSRKQPSVKRKKRRKKKKIVYKSKRSTKTSPQAKSFIDTHLLCGRGLKSNTQTHLH